MFLLYALFFSDHIISRPIRSVAFWHDQSLGHGRGKALPGATWCHPRASGEFCLQDLSRKPSLHQSCSDQSCVESSSKNGFHMVPFGSIYGHNSLGSIRLATRKLWVSCWPTATLKNVMRRRWSKTSRRPGGSLGFRLLGCTLIESRFHLGFI